MEPIRPQVIFHDPLSNATENTSAGAMPAKSAVQPRTRKRANQADRKEAARIKAIESVSRDLATLAAMHRNPRR